MGALFDRYAPAFGGERPSAVCLATQQRTFSGRAVVLGVAGGRLLLVGLDRRGEPAGEPVALDVAEASANGLSHWSADPAAWLIDDAGLLLKLRLADGEKLKLRLLKGGSGLLGRAGGGEDQAAGVA